MWIEQQLHKALDQLAELHPKLAAERRARNTFALLALVGWVVALALLGHGGAV